MTPVILVHDYFNLISSLFTPAALQARKEERITHFINIFSHCFVTINLKGVSSSSRDRVVF